MRIYIAAPSSWLWSLKTVSYKKWDKRIVSSCSSSPSMCSNSDRTVTGSLPRKSSKILYSNHSFLDSSIGTKSPRYLVNPALDVMRACWEAKNAKGSLEVQKEQSSPCWEFRKYKFDPYKCTFYNTMGITWRVTSATHHTLHGLRGMSVRLTEPDVTFVLGCHYYLMLVHILLNAHV